VISGEQALLPVEQFLAVPRFEQRDKLEELPIDLNRIGRDDFNVNMHAGLIAYCRQSKKLALRFVNDLNASAPNPSLALR
jgi:hypothetical protein